ncbi:hypothetical protein [Thalassospira xiamenensis]|uniref:hypothetical protein n=1 Tax=Thalassospira xiamenensis TaxID=220697 RepID=UPI0011BD838E|nr:hypothetical protein [Thalassospira xiamenensis]
MFSILGVLVGIGIGVTIVVFPQALNALRDPSALASLLGAFFAGMVGLLSAIGLIVHDRIMREEQTRMMQLGVVIASKVAVLPFVGYFSNIIREHNDREDGLPELLEMGPRIDPPELRNLVEHTPELARIDPKIAHEINCMINAFRMTLPDLGNDQDWVVNGAEGGLLFAENIKTLLSKYEEKLGRRKG